MGITRFWTWIGYKWNECESETLEKYLKTKEKLMGFHAVFWLVNVDLLEINIELPL